MRVAILGAGSIGLGCAALAAERGHHVTIWLPSGRSAEGAPTGIEAEGAIEGRFPARFEGALDAALADAEAALLVVPAFALPTVLPRIAAVLPNDLALMIAPAASLAPLALDRLLAERGSPSGRAPIGAMGTTPLMARRLAPGRVRVAAVRSRLDMAAIPSTAAPDLAALAGSLFGNDYGVSPDVLHVALANPNPITHAALVLANVTRMERAEMWPQYDMMTPAVCRLMDALASERDRMADAWGIRVDSLAEFLHRSNGVPKGPLHEMTAAIARSRASVTGPTALDTRYVSEDVPFGLVFYLQLAAARGIAMPVTEAVVTTLESLWGRGLRGNPILESLDLTRLGPMLRDGIGRV